MADFHSGAAAGTNASVDWGPLKVGVRRFLKENLTGPLPPAIPEQLGYEDAIWMFVDSFPDLVSMIQGRAFEVGTLGQFMAARTHEIVSKTSRKKTTNWWQVWK